MNLEMWCGSLEAFEVGDIGWSQPEKAAVMQSWSPIAEKKVMKCRKTAGQICPIVLLSFLNLPPPPNYRTTKHQRNITHHAW